MTERKELSRRAVLRGAAVGLAAVATPDISVAAEDAAKMGSDERIYGCKCANLRLDLKGMPDPRVPCYKSRKCVEGCPYLDPLDSGSVSPVEGEFESLKAGQTLFTPELDKAHPYDNADPAAREAA